MFKNIFDAKISEKLNNFNNLSKAAVSSVNFGDWTDKFRQTIDISEKIQNFNFNDIQNSLNGNNNVNANSNASNTNIESAVSQPEKNKPNGHINQNNKPQNDQSTHNSNKRKESLDINNYDSENSPPISPKHHREPLQQQSSLSVNAVSTSKNNSKSNNNKHIKNQNSINTSMQSNDGEMISPSASSFLSQKSTNDSHNQQQQNNGKAIVEDEVENDTPRLEYAKLIRQPSVNSNGNSRTLVRQSTDLTSSFPLKPFQKINSETVDIPGLNVKVVRYRIENDLGKIDPHLYKSYNSSVDPTTAITKGKLFFSLHYNEEIKSLSVTINKAEIFNVYSQGFSSTNSNNNTNTSSLTNSPNLNKPDTYVKIQLLPDKKKKFQTRVQRKTWTPVYDETFYFQLDIEELKTRTLFLTHLEFGRFSKHELIGAVRIGDINLIKDITTGDIEFTRNLTPLVNDDLELGELTLTLCYLPAAGRLTVTIVKAINLKSMDINGKSDPYVKVTLVSRGKRIKKKKTSVMKNTLHPVYNESMLFDIPQDQIEQVDMIVKVIDYDRVGQNELIGCIGIGPSFSGIGRDHWYRMIENQRKPMTQSYYLRDSSFLREGLPAKIEKALYSDRQESIESTQS